MDFLRHQQADDRHYRLLNVIDDYRREGITIKITFPCRGSVLSER